MTMGRGQQEDECFLSLPCVSAPTSMGSAQHHGQHSACTTELSGAPGRVHLVRRLGGAAVLVRGLWHPAWGGRLTVRDGAGPGALPSDSSLVPLWQVVPPPLGSRGQAVAVGDPGDRCRRWGAPATRGGSPPTTWPASDAGGTPAAAAMGARPRTRAATHGDPLLSSLRLVSHPPLPTTPAARLPSTTPARAPPRPPAPSRV